MTPATGDHVTGLRLRLNEASGEMLAQRLREGNPAVWVYAEIDSIFFGMHTVQDGDAPTIAAALRRALGQ